jgi:hypothetical protein
VLKHEHASDSTALVGGKFELEDRWLDGFHQRSDTDDADGFPAWSDKLCFYFGLNRFNSLLVVTPDAAGFSRTQLRPGERQ